MKQSLSLPRMNPATLATLACATLLASSCQVPASQSSPSPSTVPAAPLISADLPISRAPYHEVSVNWKQRLDQPYVFLEARGSYTGIGGLLEQVDALMTEQGLDPAGPPFGLYYDDPGKVAVEALRMRACFPVLGAPEVRSPLAYSVLGSTTVVYAFIGGAYPEVPRAYPGLYDFMRKLNWVEDGPIRETYLVNPALVDNYDLLVCEVQIPAASAP